MDGLLGYPHLPVVSPPQDGTIKRLLQPLSSDSLRQLERSAKEPVAACKVSRIQNWVRELAVVTPTGSLPVRDISSRQDHLDRPSERTHRQTTGGVESNNNVNAAIRGHSSPTRDTMHRKAGHTMPSVIQDLHTIIDLTVPSSKRPKLSEKTEPATQSQELKPQTPVQRSSSGRRVPSSANPTATSEKASQAVDAKNSHMKESTTDLTTDQKSLDTQRENYFKRKVQDLFPDICETYVQTLYSKYKATSHPVDSAVQNALEEILTEPSYPKKQLSRKRKQIDEGPGDADLQRIREDKIYYFSVAYKLLHRHFRSVNGATIKDVLGKHKTFFKSYVALYHLGHPITDASKYWERLHNAEDKLPPLFAKVLEHELEQAKKLIADKEEADMKKKQERQLKRLEEEHRMAGTLVECQCCFCEVIPDRAVPCDGDAVHLFCYDCINQKAEVQVGLMRYELKCFDTSGCEAEFNRSVIREVIGEKLMKRLEDLQQQDEIAKAAIDGLEECPFCEFKAICPPIEENKEFTCLNSECAKVSCRLCKTETHIPQTCEEAKKERGLEERHAVEEAMTAALVRKCPQCGLAIVKLDGCNKIVCRCGTHICDVCKKDITKSGYEHFQNGTCTLHEIDTGVGRRQSEVIKAEQGAVAKLLAQDVNIDPETVRVTSESERRSNQQSTRQREAPRNAIRAQPRMPQMPPMPNIPPVPPIRQMIPMAQMRPIPQMPPVQVPARRNPQRGVPVPQAAPPILHQAPIMPQLNPQIAMPQIIPPMPRLPTFPGVLKGPIEPKGPACACRNHAHHFPPAQPTKRTVQPPPNTVNAPQPRVTTPNPTQTQQQRQRQHVPQFEVIPPGPPPALVRAKSMPNSKTRQPSPAPPQPPRPPANHQYSLRRRD